MSEPGSVADPEGDEHWRDLPRYALPGDVTKVIPVPADALGGLLLAVSHLLLELMVSQGRVEEFRTILGGVLLTSTRGRNFTIGIRYGLRNDHRSCHHQVGGHEHGTANACGVDVLVLPLEPDERVNKAVLLLIAIGVLSCRY